MKIIKTICTGIAAVFSILPTFAQQTYEELEQLTVNEQVTTVITASEPIRFVDICMCGKSGKFLIFQDKFSVRILVLFLRGIVYLLDACPVCKHIAFCPLAESDNANNTSVSVDEQASAFSCNPHV